MHSQLLNYTLVLSLAAVLPVQVQGVPPPKAVPPSQAAPAAKAVPPADPAQHDLAVTITYTGRGKIDATHKLMVFLFTSPDVGAAGEPIAMQVAEKSGATVTFKGVLQKPVYVCAIYDEKGGYNGHSGPPPVGTPISVYRKANATAPTGVTPGPDASVHMTFNDAKRFGQ